MRLTREQCRDKNFVFKHIQEILLLWVEAKERTRQSQAEYDRVKNWWPVQEIVTYAWHNLDACKWEELRAWDNVLGWKKRLDKL